MINTEQLIIVKENGSKTINFELLEQRYGSELSRVIKNDIEYCLESNQPWGFEIIYESGIRTIAVCASKYWSQVYEVSNKRKVIESKYIIGKRDCEAIFNLMNSF